MKISVDITDRGPTTKHVVVDGMMDAATSPQFDDAIAPALASAATVVVLDLAKLTYISSAGIRSLFKARKAMESRNGSLLVVNVTPQVQRVFDIIQALPGEVIFRSVAELDEYLDAMQRKA